jgi:nicotinamide-nucleotide amidase
MTDEPAIELAVGRRLRSHRLTLAVAESCTGGLIGHRITSVGGSSEYFLGGVIAYANAVKVRELGVDREVLAAEGAVSEPVARAMALGVREKFGADIGVGTTGIAGPTGGTREKPVGLVFIGVAGKHSFEVRSFTFPGSREEVKRAASEAALNMVREHLDKHGS